MKIPVRKSSWAGNDLIWLKLSINFNSLNVCASGHATLFRKKKTPWQTARKCIGRKKEKGRPPQCDFIRSSSMNLMQNCFSIMVPKIFGQRLNQHSSIDTEAQGHRDVTGAQARRFRFPVSPHTYIQIISVSNAFPACYILFLKSVPRYNRRWKMSYLSW